jgi:hypothetical protein
MPAMRSDSYLFIWQPYVMTAARFGSMRSLSGNSPKIAKIERIRDGRGIHSA